MPSKISLADIWESISNWSQGAYQEAKKLSKFHWAMLLGLPLLYFGTKEDEIEEYAINYLEEEILRNSSEFN